MNVTDWIFIKRAELRRAFWTVANPKVLETETRRAAFNKELQGHWAPQSIDVYELIWEHWETDDKVRSENRKDERFIVYIDPDMDIDWINNSDPGADGEKCVLIAESIGAKRCKHLPREHLLEFRRMIGHALVSGLQDQVEISKKLSNEAFLFLRDRTIERSRSWTLTSAHLLLCVWGSVWMIGWHLHWSSYSRVHEHIFGSLAFLGGIVGAYLSVVQKAGRGSWEAASGRWLHLLEAFTKIVAGGIFGEIALLIAHSSWAPPPIVALVANNASGFLVGVAAGFCERLIPKIISTYAKDAEKPATTNI